MEGRTRKFPEPIVYGPIIIPAEETESKEDLKYTDCVEISFFRFLQASHLNDNDCVDVKIMKENGAVQELIEFFEKHNATEVLPESYYVTEEGYQFRNKWALFVAKREGVIYKKDKFFEIISSVPNVCNLFQSFFPTNIAKLELQKLEDSAESDFKKILKHFSRGGLEFDAKMHHKEKEFDSDYIFDSKTMEIFINGEPIYDWQLYQYFNYGERTTGHSDFRWWKPK
jgi:hypothetical protein